MYELLVMEQPLSIPTYSLLIPDQNVQRYFNYMPLGVKK